jgi:spermidine synthase
VSSAAEPSERFLLSALPFASAIFIGAFLIFFVQPMVGKHILPWFGGGAGVWTLCLVFYQSTLFLGYGYAHLLVRFASPKAQLVAHVLLVGAALFALPVLPAEGWKPNAMSEPSRHILAMLSANVALPFLVLASTGPLVQAWFARRFPRRSPYPLYALSNAGSLLALIAYPVLVEPRWALSAQSRAWSAGFGIACAVVLACAGLASRAAPEGAGRGGEKSTPGARGERSVAAGAFWLSLPACAVVLLMGVTNQLCSDVASVPFLWIAPLCIYLLTFILCFGYERLYHRGLWSIGAVTFLVILFGVGGVEIASGTRAALHLSFEAAMASYLGLLLCICMILHGELYRMRPPAEDLTSFYLCISGGGALGGLFVGILAPQIFDAYYELPFALAACWLLVVWIAWRERPKGPQVGWRRWIWPLIQLSTTAALVTLVIHSSWRSPEVRLQERNFYGILRVVEAAESDPIRHNTSLLHGTTSHGIQYRNAKSRRRATSYYGIATGIGYVMKHRKSEEPRKVGLIGLGAGTLATYGLEGDRFIFYEIDPAIERIARDQRFFSFLGESKAGVEVVVGDARLSLEAQLRDHGGEQFDLLVIDAFSGDSIPIHLLNQQAFQLFARHLKPDGVIAVHLSNRRLELYPLVFRIAESVGFEALYIFNFSVPQRVSGQSKWVVLTRDTAYLAELRFFVRQRQRALRLPERAVQFKLPSPKALEDTPLWTDDFSDLWSALK